ncbi:hypothetical protein N7532_005339 [Penicillium argentinense]|uniref:Uncharacterized protein n=1 Tax=Penicillium argentinense TaxID=1131581 RepID=A0A9W9K9W0_9EURO|nr:uncharacterized protein N7532_005339 [Penicillium argentinense]KAJ5098338.1 hypothetical protein N7532_005339 [Penicillium argentinense]
MTLPEPPLWCRISFAPQIWRIQKRQSIEGISLSYVLWNLISSTENVTIYIFTLVNQYDPSDKTIFLHFPYSAGDWFSLAHCAVVTLLFLALFVQVLRYSDRRTSLCIQYTAFLLISLIPLLIDGIVPMRPWSRRFWLVGYWALHSFFIWPIITFLGFFSIYRQAQTIRAVPFPNSLSLHGLAVQAFVFMLLSVTWIFALPFPYEKLEGQVNMNVLIIWYASIGWVIVDSFVFAIGQTILLALALRRRSSDDIPREGETEPLLGDASSRDYSGG